MFYIYRVFGKLFKEIFRSAQFNRCYTVLDFAFCAILEVFLSGAAAAVADTKSIRHSSENGLFKISFSAYEPTTQRRAVILFSGSM